MHRSEIICYEISEKSYFKNLTHDEPYQTQPHRTPDAQLARSTSTTTTHTPGAGSLATRCANESSTSQLARDVRVTASMFWANMREDESEVGCISCLSRKRATAQTGLRCSTGTDKRKIRGSVAAEELEDEAADEDEDEDEGPA